MSTQQIEVNGISVRYRIDGADVVGEAAGEGKPWVTLSHSLTTDLTMWEPLAAALSADYRVLRYDTRGHGGSGAATPLADGAYSFDLLVGDVLGLWDALGIAHSHFVGLSMGGMIGQQLALAAPQRVDKLVVANSTSRMPPQMQTVWAERIAQARAEGLAAMVEPTLARWFTPPFRAAQPALMARIGALIAATPVAGYVGCGAAIRELDLTDRLPGVAAPTLVIVGADDPGTPPAVSEVIAAAIPGARLAVIAAASHLSCLEQEAAFNRLVIDFLGS